MLNKDGKTKASFYKELSNSFIDFFIRSMASSSCSSLMVSGGVKRMISPCVGFASTPFSFIDRHTSQAVLPFIALIVMAFSSPLPRTSLMKGD
jgi:hypothetical protein